MIQDIKAVRLDDTNQMVVIPVDRIYIFQDKYDMIKTTILNFNNEDFVACNQGAQFDATLTWKNADGSLKDLSGYTALMQVRRTYNHDVLVELSTDNGKITMDSSGNIRFLINFLETSMMPYGLFTYDFKLFSPDGTPDIPFRGDFKIYGAITV